MHLQGTAARFAQTESASSPKGDWELRAARASFGGEGRGDRCLPATTTSPLRADRGERASSVSAPGFTLTRPG